MFLHFFWVAFICCCTLVVKAQEYEAIDQYVKSRPLPGIDSVEDLVGKILQDSLTEREKARSIYVWLAYHISYDKKAYTDGKRRINSNNRDLLLRRKAVCFGYSTLFKEMCEIVGIRAEVISGYSRGTRTSTINKSQPDHAWNAVKLDGDWYLLDVTWGSGVIQAQSAYLKASGPEYFLSPPEVFIIHHLPIQPMWQLLNCPVFFEDFVVGPSAIEQHLKQSKQCFDYTQAINNWSALPTPQRQLEAANMAYRFRVSADTRAGYGHALVDYAGRLSDQKDTLDPENNLDALFFLHLDLLNRLQEAEQFIDFFPWQANLFMSESLNFGVFLYNEYEALEQKELVSQAFFEIALGFIDQASSIFFEVNGQESYYEQYILEEIKEIRAVLSKFIVK